MTLVELYQAMQSELPDLANVCFYDHIEIDEGGELYPPFLFFHEVNGNPFVADNQVYYLGVENRVDLYTSDRSVEIRAQLIEFFNSHDIPFTLSLDEFDPDTMLYMDSFTIALN